MKTIENSLDLIAQKYNYKDWDALEFDLDLSIITPMIKEAMMEYANQFKYGILDSAAISACKLVVDGYEGDGMENMQERDKVFYQHCKDAIKA